jgi:hypothetical protein
LSAGTIRPWSFRDHLAPGRVRHPYRENTAFEGLRLRSARDLRPRRSPTVSRRAPRNRCAGGPQAGRARSRSSARTARSERTPLLCRGMIAAIILAAGESRRMGFPKRSSYLSPKGPMAGNDLPRAPPRRHEPFPSRAGCGRPRTRRRAHPKLTVTDFLGQGPAGAERALSGGHAHVDLAGLGRSRNSAEGCLVLPWIIRRQPRDRRPVDHPLRRDASSDPPPGIPGRRGHPVLFSRAVSTRFAGRRVSWRAPGGVGSSGISWKSKCRTRASAAMSIRRGLPFVSRDPADGGSHARDAGRSDAELSPEISSLEALGARELAEAERERIARFSRWVRRRRF